MISYAILGVTFAFAATVQPGPLQTYLISQTLSKGWRKTLPASFAPVISDGPIILIVLFVLNNLPLKFLSILQLGGGIFLLYLAYGSYKSWKNYVEEKRKDSSRKQTLLKAATVNLLNPNPYLGWSLVMGPLLLKGWNENPWNGVALIVSFYVTIILGLALTIILVSAARGLGPKTNKILIGISSLVLLCFSIYELYSGITSLANN